jgi:hypothetical protein
MQFEILCPVCWQSYVQLDTSAQGSAQAGPQLIEELYYLTVWHVSTSLLPADDVGKLPLYNVREGSEGVWDVVCASTPATPVLQAADVFDTLDASDATSWLGLH